MFYEETVIDGVLMCRSVPRGEWRPVSNEVLTQRLVLAEARIPALEHKVSVLEAARAEGVPK